MKAKKWFCLGMPLFVGAAMLLASQNTEKRLPPDQRIWFTIPGQNAGRPLTPEETATIQQAIESIRTPPPSSLSWTDALGESHTAACSTIAMRLREQLERGAMEAETLDQTIYGAVLHDGRRTTEGDEMNIDPKLVELAGLDPTKLKYLEIVLVHEYIHKTQCTESATGEEREIEALLGELAYMDSLGMDTTDAFYRATMEDYCIRWVNYLSPDSVRWKELFELKWNTNFCAHIRFDTMDTGPDYFVSFGLGDQDGVQYNLYPTQASDMMIFGNYPYFPAGHSLALICGGADAMGMGRILTLDVFQGQVVAPFLTYDFGPPNYPSMFFGSMTRCPVTNTYYVLDTLNWQILRMGAYDWYLIPSTITSIYACAAWPGFGALWGIRGLEVAGYVFLRGFGLLVNYDDVHLPHAIDPYATYLFLPDANGDGVADTCVSIYAYEFLYFAPHIQVPLPVEGDQVVQLFATWMRNIQVWASDSLGQNLSELLGATQMTNGVDAECQLSRALVEGEFILPMDQTTGQRPRLATRVGHYTAIDETIPLLPSHFALLAPFPNPFNATTTLRFELPRAATVSLRIYDILGREAATLVSDARPAGHHSVVWNASNFPSGLYLARLEAVGFTQTQKLLLLK